VIGILGRAGSFQRRCNVVSLIEFMPVVEKAKGPYKINLSVPCLLLNLKENANCNF